MFPREGNIHRTYPKGCQMENRVRTYQNSTYLDNRRGLSKRGFDGLHQHKKMLVLQVLNNEDKKNDKRKKSSSFIVLVYRKTRTHWANESKALL